MDMAKEVSTWQAAVLKQCEQHSMEKTAQVGRLGYVVNLANEKIAHLEGLSGSISVVYSLAGEAMRLKSIISKQEEQMQYASKVHEDMKTPWAQLSESNASLRAQLVSINVGRSLEQQDMSMRSPEDDNLRVELAASLARESALGSELQNTRFEVQQFVFGD